MGTSEGVFLGAPCPDHGATWLARRTLTHYPDSICDEMGEGFPERFMTIRRRLVSRAMLGRGGAGVLLSTSLPR